MSSNGGSDDPFAHELRLIAAAERQEFDGDAGSSANGGLLAAKVAKPLPTAIGAYRPLRKLGEGGMGVVYEAEQDHPQRSVALKVVRGGPYVDERRIRLFEREIRTLARLKHANIAAIYEAGCTEDGQHFFAMELVRGKPLLRYTRNRQLSVRDTLELFAKICTAINYAHRRGVIHRDLKPSNILVDAAGEPHVLDFGLAKIVEDDGDTSRDPSARSQTGKFVGSLFWASPEQASESPDGTDVRSDVYSLGVILFQLLTGEFPYHVFGPTKEVLENILSAAPTKPRSLRREIDGETATIMLKCLAKEPERRYQTAGELAADIRRRLADEPIEAKRDSGWYLLRKSLQRYRWQAGAVGAVATMLVILVVSMSFQTGQLRDERDTSRAANLKLADAALRLARLQADFGDIEESYSMLSELAELCEQQILLEPDVVEWDYYLYTANDGLFLLDRERRDFKSAELHLAVVRREAHRLVEMEPENPKWQRATAFALQRKGVLHYSYEQYQKAYDSFKEESEIREKLRGDEPVDLVIRKERALVDDWLAKCCNKLGGRREEEMTYRFAVLDAFRDLSTADPDKYDFVFGRAQAANNLASWHIRLKTPTSDRAAARLLDEAFEAVQTARQRFRRTPFKETQDVLNAVQVNRRIIGTESASEGK